MHNTRITLLFITILAVSPVFGNYDRAELTGYIDQYFNALLSYNTSDMALTDNAKITLNGDIKSLAETFWENAESVKFRLVAEFFCNKVRYDPGNTGCYS